MHTLSFQHIRSRSTPTKHTVWSPHRHRICSFWLGSLDSAIRDTRQMRARTQPRRPLSSRAPRVLRVLVPRHLEPQELLANWLSRGILRDTRQHLHARPVGHYATTLDSQTIYSSNRR